MDIAAFLMRLGLALLLGALIGLERQWRHRMAGIRTNALVATAAAAFAMIGLITPGDGNVARIVGQIVSGVGFLGAGVIFKEGANIRGLNTAATVWCAAAVGSLSGAGFPLYAVGTAFAVVLANIALRPLTYRFQQPEFNAEAKYDVQVTCASKDEMQIRALLLSAVDRDHLAVVSLHSEVFADDESRVQVHAELKAMLRNDDLVEQLVGRLSLEQCVSSISWRFEQQPAID